jgi:hypothetical protein
MATRTANTAIIDTHGVSYVEWSAVIAGTVLACAISVVLVQFGNGIGLSVTRFQHDETITSGKILVVGLWLLWVQLMASMAGGYLAGRMRGTWSNQSHESEIRDGAHGLLVWATSSVAAVSATAIAAFLATVAAKTGADTTIVVPADLLHKSGVILNFSLAAASLVSAVAACGMGVLGGEHRDQGVDSSRYVTFRKKKK